MPETTEQERKLIIQSVLDRLLYCEGYKEELLHLNEHFDPKATKVNYTTNITDFKFPLENAIN